MLLILTDGDINDVESTQRLLKDAENLPLSVMILRIGMNQKKTADRGGEEDGIGLDKLEQIKKHQKQVYSQADPKTAGRDIFRYLDYNPMKGIKDEEEVKKVFKFIPKQFLEYMNANGIFPKKSPEAKGSNSKREIKRKLKEKRSKNYKMPHPISVYLATVKEKFIKGITPVGYDMNLINEITENGLRALEFNLLAELLAQMEKERLEAKNQPINLANMSDEEATPKLSRKTTDDTKMIEPMITKLYTKDKVPEKKFREWNNKKNEAYVATQQMLLNAENEEISYWDKYLPQAIVSQFKTRKEKQRVKQEVEVDTRIDKAILLEPYLDKEKVKFDERYGAKTNKGNMCLICGKHEISIILMNCGHAISCVDCKKDIQEACPICGIVVSYFIHATHKMEDKKISRQNTSMNEEDFDKASNLIKLDDEEDRDAESEVESHHRREIQRPGGFSPESSEIQTKKGMQMGQLSDEYRSPMHQGTPSIAQMAVGMHKRNNFVTGQKNFVNNDEELQGLNSANKSSKLALKENLTPLRIHQASNISKQDEEYQQESYAALPNFKKNANQSSIVASPKKPARRGASDHERPSLVNNHDKSLSEVNLLGHEVKSMRSDIDLEEGNRSQMEAKMHIEAINWNEELSRDGDESSGVQDKSFTETEEDHFSQSRAIRAKNSNMPSSDDEEDPSEAGQQSRSEFQQPLSREDFPPRLQQKQAYVAQRRAGH